MATAIESSRNGLTNSPQKSEFNNLEYIKPPTKNTISARRLSFYNSLNCLEKFCCAIFEEEGAESFWLGSGYPTGSQAYDYAQPPG
jgi:hypothetical protein